MLAANPRILGTTIRVGAGAFQIIGVAPGVIVRPAQMHHKSDSTNCCNPEALGFLEPHFDCSGMCQEMQEEDWVT
jgi:hypothetical protein